MIGYIYKICNKNTDKIYIGSTVNEIEERLNEHKRDYKKYLNNKKKYITSFEIINDQTCFVELIVEVHFDNKHQLHKRERMFIEMYKDICVNKIIPTRTRKEYDEDNKEKLKEYSKKYREDNKDKTKEYFKEYWQENKEKINEKRKKYDKQYRENNKDKINEKIKEYYQDNKEKINEKMNCNICNKLVAKKYMKNHQKTSICIKKDSQNTNNNINKTFKIKIKKIEKI